MIPTRKQLEDGRTIEGEKLMYDELVKRLREMSEWSNIKWEDYSDNAQETMKKAADAIEELCAENERLRKAVLRYEDELGILDKLPLVDQREQAQEGE